MEQRNCFIRHAQSASFSNGILYQPASELSSPGFSDRTDVFPSITHRSEHNISIYLLGYWEQMHHGKLSFWTPKMEAWFRWFSFSTRWFCWFHGISKIRGFYLECHVSSHWKPSERRDAIGVVQIDSIGLDGCNICWFNPRDGASGLRGCEVWVHTSKEENNNHYSI